MMVVKQQRNGSGLTWKWAVSILVTLLGILSMAFGDYLYGELCGTHEAIMAHVGLPGHPVALERINAMRHDIDEIKVDQREIQVGVNELLRRVPPH